MKHSTSLCTNYSLTEISSLVAKREISPLDIVQDALKNIHKYDSLVGAFINLTEEEALNQAEKLQREWEQGLLRGPLHGIPISYKDNIATKGIPTTANSRSFANWVPEENAEVVNLLQEAGTVSLGKVGLWELAGGAPTANSLHAAPRNPWSLLHSPGGSSSGSAAAVAAGFGLASIGTDTGGSIRYPAASCGLVGLKPTLGTVSTRGVIPLSKTLDHVGALTRTVADNLLLLTAISSHTQSSWQLDWCKTANLRGLRLGVPWHFLDAFEYDMDCRVAFDEALTVLITLGAQIKAVHLPTFQHASAWGGEITALDALETYGERMRRDPSVFDSSFTKRVLSAENITQERRAWLGQARQRCLHEWKKVQQDIDVIVTPASRGVVDTMTEVFQEGYGPRAEYTRMYNVSGMPALTMPMGWSGGLPLSIQFAAGYHQEALLYRIALAYEEAAGWTLGRQPPLLSH